VRIGFMAEFLRLRTISLAVIALMFEFGNLHQYDKVPNINMWDVILPSLTHSHFLVLFGLLWWLFVLNENISTLNASTELIRFGSKSTAFRYVLAQSAQKFFIACFAISLATIPIAISCGLSLDFSASSLELASLDQSFDVYAAASWAQVTSSPIFALSSNSFFAFFSFICLASVHCALVLQERSKFANYLVASIYFAASASSFGGISQSLALDPVSLFDLAWALHTGSLIVVSCTWVIIFSLVMFREYIQDFWRSLMENWTSWPTLVVVGSTSALISMSSSHHNFAQSWNSNFLGKDDTLFGYARISMLVMIVAAAAVNGFKAGVADNLSHVQMRYGSKRDWLVRQIKTIYLFCCLGVATVISASVASDAIIGFPPTVTDWLQILRSSVALLLTVCIYSSLGVVVLVVADGTNAWLWAFIFGLGLGYLPQLLPGEFNVFALYSASLAVSNDSFLHSLALGLLVLLSLCSILSVKVLLLNSPKLMKIEG